MQATAWHAAGGGEVGLGVIAHHTGGRYGKERADLVGIGVLNLGEIERIVGAIGRYSGRMVLRRAKLAVFGNGANAGVLQPLIRDSIRAGMKIRAVGVLLAIVWMISGCGTMPERDLVDTRSGYIHGDSGVGQHVYVLRGSRRSSADADRWIIMLPGSSGLKVLGDTTHYFDAGQRFAEHGFTVLLVDYKALYRASKERPKVETGDKIAWVVQRVVEWGRQERHIAPNSTGSIAAWSLGAEGIWAIGNQAGDGFERLGIDRCVAWYPSVERAMDADGVQELEVPVLAFAGEADDVTLLEDLRRELDVFISSGTVELMTYEEALHGFDIVSLGERQSVRFPPIIGEQVTFGYNAIADRDAWDRAILFLNDTKNTDYQPFSP